MSRWPVVRHVAGRPAVGLGRSGPALDRSFVGLPCGGAADVHAGSVEVNGVSESRKELAYVRGLHICDRPFMQIHRAASVAAVPITG